MPLLDMSLEEMRAYRPAREEPPDFGRLLGRHTTRRPQPRSERHL